ncbi:leptin receptor isoform X2 [Brachyhypopomus gauderio]|uniref:leptin receptor isoform X2 n=1 Tax=Brachyhypopomus gauderio TaxID=698409 RepID=UPI0040434433
MIFCVMLALIVNLIIALHGEAALSPIGVWPGEYQGFEWRALLCCELASFGPGPQGEASGVGPDFKAQNHSFSHSSRGLPPNQCHIHNYTNGEEDSSESQDCLDILCWLEDKQANMICYIKHHRVAATSTSHLTVSLQAVPMDLDPQAMGPSPLAWCTGHGAITCSVALHTSDVSVSLLVSGSLNGRSLLAPDLRISTHLLCKPHPPMNLHYNVSTEGEVIFAWSDSPTSRYPLNYEIRYSSNTSLKHWEVLQVQHPWVALRSLTLGDRNVVQVRSRRLHEPLVWSDWSLPFYQTLDVSYIPTEVLTKPGAEATVYGVFHNGGWAASKVVWMLNGQVIPESQYKVVNARVSAVTFRSKDPGFGFLMGCLPWGERFKCSIAYAKVYTEGLFDANITCQSDQWFKRDSMTCKWNKSAWAVVRFLYRSYRKMCEELSHEERAMAQMGEESVSGVEECLDGAGDFHECTLRGLSLFSCYKLWLEMEGGHGKVRSLPVFVSPVDYVKPSPPSDLEAVTWPNKTLSVRWTRPGLPVYHLQYELRYVASQEMADQQWKVVGPVSEPSATVLVQDQCVQYKVEVRCRRFKGSGYWSDWSEPRASSVYSAKAPVMGPDFWRVIQEDTAANSTNVTLLFKPIPAEDPAECVLGLVVLHQASGGTVWSDDIALGSFYTFHWKEDIHTITVISHNSLGSSGKNNNLTLVRQPKRHCVRWFRAAANATCVSLSWALLSEHPPPLSFVIEWVELKEAAGPDGSLAGSIEWLRVPPTTRELHVCQHLDGVEEFRLFPVFADGEGESVACRIPLNDPAAYLLLLIIAFLFIVLFVTLIVSQNQMKKLIWKDVPNPNNCSWAKRMEFRKLDGTENVFGHPETLTACPLLLISESICEVEIVEKPHLLSLEKEHEQETHHFMEGRRDNMTTVEGSLEPLSLDVSTTAATPETSGQSSVTYSAVLLFDQPALLIKQHKSLSSSSDEGNFSANNSDISGSFPGGLWDLENPSGSDITNPRNSYNSVEEFSEISEQEDEALESKQVVKELYYLGMNEEEEEEENEDCEEEGEAGMNIHVSQSVEYVDSGPQLEYKDSRACNSNYTCQRSIPLYLPQFQTAAIKPLRETVDNSAL